MSFQTEPTATLAKVALWIVGALVFFAVIGIVGGYLTQ